MGAAVLPAAPPMVTMVAMVAVVAVVAVVIFAMVAASHIGVKGEGAIQQGLYRLVSIPGDTSIELDPCCIQSGLGSTTNSTADQSVHL